MTDIAVETFQYTPPDRSWLLTELQGIGQPVTTTSGTLDFTKFTAGTHYPAGHLPSGLALGVVTATGRIGPYNNAQTDGTQTCVGFLYNPIQVPTDTARKVQAALVDSFAVVQISKLPTGNGLDAAGQADLPLIKFRP
jgi:hypothetical protein